MLISGLWKLAAMAGVIGVGLVAVYQAQKGLHPTSIVATGLDDSGDAGSLPTAGNASEPVGLTPTPLTTDPLKLEDPFAAQPTRTASARPQEFPEADNAREPFERTASATPQPVADFTDDAAGSANTLSGPGLDFRAEATSSGPELGGAAAKSTIQQTGFEGAQPGRLPDEADLLPKRPRRRQPLPCNLSCDRPTRPRPPPRRRPRPKKPIRSSMQLLPRSRRIHQPPTRRLQQR